MLDIAFLLALCCVAVLRVPASCLAGPAHWRVHRWPARSLHAIIGFWPPSSCHCGSSRCVLLLKLGELGHVAKPKAEVICSTVWFVLSSCLSSCGHGIVGSCGVMAFVLEPNNIFLDVVRRSDFLFEPIRGATLRNSSRRLQPRQFSGPRSIAATVFIS